MDTNALSYWQQLDLLLLQSHAPRKAGVIRNASAVPKTPMTVTEMMIVDKLQAGVTFPPGGSHKRFIRGLKMNSELSDRGRLYLAYIAHRYRRQWVPSAEETQWIIRWGKWSAEEVAKARAGKGDGKP